MEYSYLFPFEQEEFVFSGAHRFSAAGRSYLLAQNGASLLMDDTLSDMIDRKAVSENLAFKLYQRGFGTVYGQPRFGSILETPLPTLFMIDFTTKCNCNCIYCLRHFENVGESISWDMLERITRYIIDYCIRYRIRRIAFQPWGGEPLIELDKILACQKMFQDVGIHAAFNVQTNGLLLNLQNYEKLREHQISVGVSIDGIAAVHDAHRLDVRGNTTHERIVRNLREILEKYPDADIGTLSVNSAYSRDHVAENVDYLIRELGMPSIKFNLVHPSGGDSFDSSMLLREEEMDKYIGTLVDAVREQVRAGRICREANIMDKLSNLLDRSSGNICNAKGCAGGLAFISFDRDGNIYPCEMIGRQEFRLGNIADENNDLPDLIRRAFRENGYYAQRRTEKCGDCPWFYFCRGGCKASCLAYGAEPCQIDRIECAVNRSLYPRLVELILTEPELAEKLAGQRIRVG